jgi:Protein of unknown function (Gmx_para_CXXCG)
VNHHNTFWYMRKPRPQPTRLEWDSLAGRKRGKYSCPADSGHNSAGARLGDLYLLSPTPPLLDVDWTWDSECVVRDDILRAFTAERFTGFQARPVHIRKQLSDDKTVPLLWEIQVSGWAGMARPESGIRRIERCAICGRQTYTGFSDPDLLVDETQWDGSDLFMVWPMPRYIFVTERVAAFIRSNELTGVETIELYQMQPSKGFTPLPLRLRMPEARARELGDPLDIY